MIRRCLPTLRYSMSPASSRPMRKGRLTLRSSAACWVVRLGVGGHNRDALSRGHVREHPGEDLDRSPRDDEGLLGCRRVPLVGAGSGRGRRWRVRTHVRRARARAGPRGAVPAGQRGRCGSRRRWRGRGDDAAPSALASLDGDQAGVQVEVAGGAGDDLAEPDACLGHQSDDGLVADVPARPDRRGVVGPLRLAGVQERAVLGDLPQASMSVIQVWSAVRRIGGRSLAISPGQVATAGVEVEGDRLGGFFARQRARGATRAGGRGQWRRRGQSWRQTDQRAVNGTRSGAGGGHDPSRRRAWSG